MCTKFILAVLSVFTFSINSYAKIWRVNNNTGVNADFTTLQLAHDGAGAGDTLHLESSPNNYGSLSCSKKIIIIGTGYFLAENSNSQALTQTAKVSTFYFYQGSEGSIVMGLDFSNNSINVYSNDIVIRRNNFAYEAGTGVFDYYTGSVSLEYQQNSYPTPVSNVIITQNFGLKVNVNYASTGILITNNYLAWNGYGGDATTGQVIAMQANASAIIQNNIIRRGVVNVSNSTLTNNILYAGSFTGTGNLFSNNLSNDTQFGNANGNQQNVDMTTVFVGSGTGISTDGEWKLSSTSPAKGAGFGSTVGNPVDAGMFGGQTPYMLAGLPPIPTIYFFTNQPIGSNSDPIDVSIKVKSVGN